MKRRKLSVLEAVDNLSNLAGLDVESKEETSWLDPAQIQNNEEKIKETFTAINEYLRHLYQKERSELKNPQTLRGLQAMMQLAGEAMDKVGKYTNVFKETLNQEKPIAEYQQLQQFYLSKIVTKKEAQPEEKWELEGTEELDVERQALKDLEAVRRDHDYELFYIRKEDGMPFFHHNLLRHIRLVGNFDETLMPKEGDDPYVKIKATLDRDFHNTAKEILHEGRVLIEKFYQEGMKFKEMTFVSNLNKSLMALMLAANPRNLFHHSAGKHCVDYFVDFQTYLRDALSSEDYARILASSEGAAQPLLQLVIKILHEFCLLLFTRSGSFSEAWALIEKISEEKELQSFWASIIAQDEAIRTALRKYPSGPLMQILEMFRDEEEKIGFDPLLQHNLPGHLFSISSDDLDVTFLHLPCPVHQEFINKPTIVHEFKGFLRELGSKKYLLFNLQDRTSWQEHSRSARLEEMQKDAEYSHRLEVVTFAKNTEFYHQIQSYADLSNAKEFQAQVKEQVLSGEQCGFHFPFRLKIDKDLDSLIAFVHTAFFEKKETLSRKERLDFIEIFYYALTLKILEQEKPDLSSFTCKDGIDTGAAAAAAFYGFTRLLSNDAPWTEEEKKFFLCTLEGPALLLRHRPIDSQRLHRALSALDHVQAVLATDRDKIVKAFSQLLDPVKVKNVA